MLWLIRLHRIFFWGKYGFKTSMHLLVDRWFDFHGRKVLHRLYVWLAACFSSRYRSNQLSSQLVSLLFGISSLVKDSLLLPLRSSRMLLFMLQGFACFSVDRWFNLNGWKVRLLSVCPLSCIFIQLTPYEEAFLVIMIVSSKLSLRSLYYGGQFVYSELGLHTVEMWMNTPSTYCQSSEKYENESDASIQSRDEWIGSRWALLVNNM